MTHKFLATSLSFFLVASSGQSGWGAQDQKDRISHLFTKGYTLLQSQVEEAIPVFEQIILIDSTNVLASRQLGSMYLQAGRVDEALQSFLRAYRHLPSDTTALQIAYLYTTLGKESSAYRIFRDLRKSKNKAIQEKARSASTVLALMVCADQFPWWVKVQAYPFYDSRFENYIVAASLYAGRHLDRTRVASLYGVLSITEDTRSEGGAFPVVYSDNYGLAGAGLRVSPFHGLIVDLQGGVALNFLDRPGTRRVKEDLRAVASYGNGLYPDVTMPDNVTVPSSVFMDFYSSFGWYSRYSNGIGYFQGKAGVRVVEYRYSALDIYIRADASIDTRRDFYNNTVEGGFGVRIIPNHWWGFAIAAELRRGAYWGTDVSLNPYSRTYSSLRITVLFDRFLCW